MMRKVGAALLMSVLLAPPAWAGGRCTAPALRDDPAIAAKPLAAKPLDPQTYARFYGPRNKAEMTGACADNRAFKFGLGQGDITGPLYDQGMAGYAKPEQLSKGKIDRQFARAFAIGTECDPGTKAVLVSVDLGLMYHGVRQEVVKRLSGKLGYAQLMITANHSHATAAGQSHHDLYNLPAGGHDAQAFDGLVSGIVDAVEQALAAYETATPGAINFAQGELLNASVQRSRPAYDQNPEAERAPWVDTDGNPVTIDRNAVTLSLMRDGKRLGVMNWFAVHGTSISFANRLLSGDNKGWAALMAEQGADAPKLAGFFQGTLGDVSPNLWIDGLSDSVLQDADDPDFMKRGGGRNDRESTYLSAMRQAETALRQTGDEPLQGGVSTAHVFVDMRTAHRDDDSKVRTCSPAYGFGAPAGAEDGRGPISEGWRCSDTSGFTQWVARVGLWGAMKFGFGMDLPEGMLDNTGCRPAHEDPDGPYGCHGEKPILAPLDYSLTEAGQPLTAPVVPFHIVTIGQFAIVGLPFEITTMAGRRIKQALLDVLEARGIDYAVVASHTNGYSHYLTTSEEYDLQLYEGASTIFGQHELDIVVQETTRLARGEPSPFAVQTYETAVTPFVHEPDASLYLAKEFTPGEVLEEPAPTQSVDQGAVRFAIRGPNPRRSPQGRDLYVSVEQQTSSGWVVVASDRSYETELIYDSDEASVTGLWYPPVTAGEGQYRMVIRGRSDAGLFQTVSSPFSLEVCPGS